LRAASRNDGFEVILLEGVARHRRYLYHHHGNKKTLIRIEHMRATEGHAIVGNIGHFDNENSSRRAENTSGQTSKNRST